MEHCIHRHNCSGMTLLEVMIAAVVLTIGIISVMAMQTRAISASASAYNRTGASSIATSLIENFHRMDFNDRNLDATRTDDFRHENLAGNLSDLNTMRQIWQNNPQGITNIAHTFDRDSLREMEGTIRSSNIAGATPDIVIDRSDQVYRLCWTVQQVNRNETSNSPIAKNIRIFMRWDTPMGPRHLERTTSKFNNTPIP